MRTLVVAGILLASLLSAPAASAAGLLEDAKGDTELRAVGDAGTPFANAQGDSVDLLAMDVLEDGETLSFVLSVASFAQTVSFSEYAIHFTWNRAEYLVVVQYAVGDDNAILFGNSQAYLIAEEDDEDFDRFADLEHEIDMAGALVTVHLPKAYLLTENGRPPLLGDVLDELYVEAEQHVTLFSFTTNIYDRMPDEGASSFTVAQGDLNLGHLRLDADERVRVSNGGATTFVYQVLLQNTGERDDEVAVTMADLPEGWNGTVQSPVKVPAGGERRIVVLASVPFAHDHGGYSSFNLTAQSGIDAGSRAIMRLGVLHTPIPQPAGHHAELYLHAASFNRGVFSEVFPWTDATMNTDSAHEGDAKEASPWSGGDGFEWRILLAPGLRMGLDFDLDRAGSLAGTLMPRMNGEGTLRGELVLLDDAGEELLLLGETDEQTLALSLNAPSTFTLAYTPLAESDYIPYARGQNLALVLYLDTGETGTICCLPGATPGLVVADFKLSLPLNEYHDRLSGLADVEDKLTLKAESTVEKAALPGTTMTYLFTLTNRDSQPHVIDVDLAGTDADLGALVPEGSFELGAGESRALTLAVDVPADANEGEELEVLVFAHAQEDPSKSAIARTKTLVVRTGASTAPLPDESEILTAARAAEENDTPLSGTLLGVVALAIVAVLVRRK